MSKADDVVSARRLVGGPYDKYRGLTPVKYPWARTIWDQMLANTWFPAEVILTADAKEYNKLDAGMRLAYDRALAFLANLDSIQLVNLADNIAPLITAPEVTKCLHRQVFEEQLHVESYSTMIESISLDPELIYFMPTDDPILEAKNDYITKQAELLKTDRSKEAIILAMAANIILEGIYFFSGFAAFHTFGRAGKVLGSSNMIKFIQRDEETHLGLFRAILRTYCQEEGLHITDFLGPLRELFDGAATLEIVWGKHIIEGGVLGLTDQIMEDYIHYLADQRMVSIGLPVMYGAKNPIPWVDEYAKINNAETAFFERRPTDYVKGGFSW